MKFKSFRIQNYKGIKDITIDFEPRGANIFTLIGLNESGKTSILEAIASFNPHLQNNDEQALYSNHEEKTIDPNKLIPKNQKANFTGKISVSAILELSEEDISILKQSIQDSEEYGEYEIDGLDKQIEIEQRRTYEDSSYDGLTNYIKYEFSFREKRKNNRSKEKVWSKVSLFDKNISFELSDFLYGKIKGFIPKVVYFPTFLFNQPEKIQLTHEEDDSINKIYTKAIRNLAKSENLDLQKHIIDRASDSAQKEALQSALDNMSSSLTETIFSRWRRILQTDFIGNREIILELTQSNDDVFINFVIKQGRERFNISERSLGFRWFFLFLLFTLYGSKNDNRKTLFLLDEPASYLHAKAQQALLDSFPKITEDGSQIIYSTHSHYLINPHWLEQAYIVANDAIDIDNETLNDAISKKNVEISLSKYRSYVNQNPTKTTYFQPVLDRLNASVSKLDFIKPSVLVEGKSDFLILEYGIKVMLDKTDIAIIPMSGAHGYHGVISLLYGWGVKFIACFDDDRAGKAEKNKIESEYPFLADNQIITLAEMVSELKGKDISGLLNQEDINLIENIVNSTGNIKSKIQLFFSEALAKNEKIDGLSEEFLKKINQIYDYLYEKLND